jgi:hypothetical protein
MLQPTTEIDLIADPYRDIVVKTEQYHDWAGELLNNDLAIGVGIYRDFRDVVVSLMHFYKKRKEHNRKFHRDGRFGQVVSNSGMQAIRWQTAWEKCKNVTFLRYEDYWPLLERMTGDIADILDIEITDAQRSMIEIDFTIDKNLNRIADIEDWIDIKDSLLTKAHIGYYSGMPDQYREVLTQEQLKTVEMVGQDWLTKHGYELWNLKENLSTT